MKKNGLVLASVICMSAVLTACSGSKADTAAAGTTAAAEAGKGKLVMVTNAEFPPYEFYENNEIIGIDADIMRAVAEKLDMELEIRDMAFDSLIPTVQSGKADLTAAGMTVTDDRKQSVDFTDTYATSTQVIIVKEGSPLSSPEDLTGKRIGVQTGTTGDLYSEDIEDSKVERFNKGMEAVMALSQDKLDAVVIDREPAKVFVEQKEGLKILDEAFTVEEYAIVVKKGNTELVDKINSALKELRESGELQKIIDQYITTE